MNYKRYTVKDLVLDRRFRKWVLNPDDEDRAFWEQCFRDHPHLLKSVNEARQLIERVPEVRYNWTDQEKADLWKSVQKDIHDPKVRKVVPLYATYESKKRRRKIKQQRAWKIAAVISILIVSISVILKQYTSNQMESGVKEIVKENPLGQKSTIYLPDGSEVMLNAGSRISYVETFGIDNRDMYLQGEAFFKVAKNKKLPFRVFADNLITTALGTSFNVRSVSGKTSSIALVTGQVSVRISSDDDNQAEQILLQPGEQALLSDNKLKKQPFNRKKEVGWKDGIIYFEDVDADYVFDYLQKWYGVKIVARGESTKKWSYSGEFKDMSLRSVLKSIGFTMNFDFEIDGSLVTVRYR